MDLYNLNIFDMVKRYSKMELNNKKVYNKNMAKLDIMDNNIPVLRMSTATISYKTSLRSDFKLISNLFKKTDKFVALKSTEIPLSECLSNPYMNAEKIIKKRRNKAKLNKKTKHRQGNGLYFHSSVEFVTIRDEPNTSPYNIRIFPKTGTTQITGVQLPIESGRKELHNVLEYIEKLLNLDEKLTIESESINMLNFGFEIPGTPNMQLKLHVIAGLFMQIQKNELDYVPPKPITFVTDPNEATAYIFIKFHTPTERSDERYTSVKIFTKRRVTMFAAPTFDIASEIHIFVYRVIYDNIDKIIFDTNTLKDTADDSFDLF